ncbi:MAG: cytochrome c oxidase accessory protein CcoG [Pirellulaceae bacterium]
MSESILEPEEHVLSTLEADGSRRWLKPRLSKGGLLWRRRIVAYVLIAIFTLVPFLKINGKPLILIDIPSREFTLFGFTFLPTDTVLLAMFMVGLLLTVFLLTALFGRIWCGWACPQTVYMEFLYRPIERLFEGTSGRGGKAKKTLPAWRTVAKYAVYLLISFYLANTFLAYFVGVEKLGQWVTQSPFNHPVPFLIMAFVTCAMMFDFSFFREQLCIIACPYGRFQSVLLDQNSLIVAYDETRGEPRGKAKKKKAGRDLPIVGDCVDCGNCVTTCPTGIDIRQGLQMECINCTQCIDACDLVMEKLGRAPNLIRYSSQSHDRGARGGLLRARTLIYPLLLAGIAIAFLTVLTNKKTFDAIIFREPVPYTMAEDGSVRNLLRLKLTNRIEEPREFQISVTSPEGASVEVSEGQLSLDSRQVEAYHIMIIVPRDVFERGRADLELKVTSGDESRNLHFRLIGPNS